MLQIQDILLDASYLFSDFIIISLRLGINSLIQTTAYKIS